MLRNKQPEYFYRLVNASFPNSRYSNGTQLVRFLFSKSNHLISFLIDRGVAKWQKLGGRFFGNFLKTFMKNCWKNYGNFQKILEKLFKFSKIF
jgi:hypothetical protein